MNGIDLDPASSEEANKRINASVIYTKEMDGLKESWAGKVFLNPPGTCELEVCGDIPTTTGKKRTRCNCNLVVKFWHRLWTHFALAEVDQFCWIGFSLEQLQNLQGKAHKSPVDFALCIPNKRISYVDAEGNKNQPTHASYIAYGGANLNAFCENFGVFGAIVVPAGQRQ
jgi:hypothetical protein